MKVMRISINRERGPLILKLRPTAPQFWIVSVGLTEVNGGPIYSILDDDMFLTQPIETVVEVPLPKANGITWRLECAGAVGNPFFSLGDDFTIAIEIYQGE